MGNYPDILLASARRKRIIYRINFFFEIVSLGHRESRVEVSTPQLGVQFSRGVFFSLFPPCRDLLYVASRTPPD